MVICGCQARWGAEKKADEMEKVSYLCCAKRGGWLVQAAQSQDPELLCQLLTPTVSLSLGLRDRVTKVTLKSLLAALEKVAEQDPGEGE